MKVHVKDAWSVLEREHGLYVQLRPSAGPSTVRLCAAAALAIVGCVLSLGLLDPVWAAGSFTVAAGVALAASIYYAEIVRAPTLSSWRRVGNSLEVGDRSDAVGAADAVRWSVRVDGREVFGDDEPATMMMRSTVAATLPLGQSSARSSWMPALVSSHTVYEVARTPDEDDARRLLQAISSSLREDKHNRPTWQAAPVLPTVGTVFWSGACVAIFLGLCIVFCSGLARGRGLGCILAVACLSGWNLVLAEVHARVVGRQRSARVQPLIEAHRKARALGGGRGALAEQFGADMLEELKSPAGTSVVRGDTGLERALRSLGATTTSRIDGCAFELGRVRGTYTTGEVDPESRQSGSACTITVRDRVTPVQFAVRPREGRETDAEVVLDDPGFRDRFAVIGAPHAAVRTVLTKEARSALLAMDPCVVTYEKDTLTLLAVGGRTDEMSVHRALRTCLGLEGALRAASESTAAAEGVSAYRGAGASAREAQAARDRAERSSLDQRRRDRERMRAAASVGLVAAACLVSAGLALWLVFQ